MDCCHSRPASWVGCDDPATWQSSSDRYCSNTRRNASRRTNPRASAGISFSKPATAATTTELLVHWRFNWRSVPDQFNAKPIQTWFRINRSARARLEPKFPAGLSDWLPHIQCKDGGAADCEPQNTEPFELCAFPFVHRKRASLWSGRNRRLPSQKSRALWG